MSEVLLSGDRLSISFGGRTLFSGVNVGLKEGDRVGLIGPNGAGKSTLLKILAKRLVADTGDVVWRKNLRVGMLEQEPLFPEGTSIESAFPNSVGFDKIAYWLSRLELNQFANDFPVVKLSGGWKRRLALAVQLAQDPDVLLLDEPTNHLDVHGVIWLENFLAEIRCALLMITHDRLFLQRTTETIWDLEPRLEPPLRVYLGGYLKYLEGKELELEMQRSREAKVKNTVRREKEWLARGAKARLTKQKARQDAAHSLIAEAADLKQRNADRKLNLSFSDTERTPKKLIEAVEISKSFGEKRILRNFSCLLNPQSRIALIGDNGAGKSTLIKLLLGKLPVDSGQLKQADGVTSILLEQERDNLDLSKSVLANILPSGGDFVHYRGQFVHVRSYLERFYFSRQQMDLVVEKLSGGERARLRLAQLLLNEAQILVLDEPTNDLDIETLNSLATAIQEFQGAVLIVSHDRYFIDQVASEIWSIEDGIVQRFADYFQWEEFDVEKRLSQDRVSQPKRLEKLVVEEKSSTGNKLSNKEKYELEKMETVILQQEELLASLRTEMTLSPPPPQLAKLYEQTANLEVAIAQLYERWSYLESKKNTP